MLKKMMSLMQRHFQFKFTPETGKGGVGYGTLSLK